MSQKRKRSDLDDSDEEEPSLGKQVLPVAHLPADFSGIPQDGLEYLFTVRRDSRLLPHVTRAANPYEIEEKLVPDILDGPTLSTAHSILPNEIWRETFLRRFRNFRKNCAQPTIHVEVPTFSRKLTPDRKDRDGWWAYLRGRPESEWNPPKKPKGKKQQHQYGFGRGMRAFQDERANLQYGDTQQAGTSAEAVHAAEEREVEQVITYNPAESLPTPSTTPAPPERGVEDAPIHSATSLSYPPEPTPTLMRQMNHLYALHILMYFAHWINLYLEEPVHHECPITEAHGRWMFVLLSRVDDYISADEQSTLRSLARGCMSLIKERMVSPTADSSADSSKHSSVIGISSCWMIITAVIGIWGQRDLWMDAEATLATVGPSGADR